MKVLGARSAQEKRGCACECSCDGGGNSDGGGPQLGD